MQLIQCSVVYIMFNNNPSSQPMITQAITKCWWCTSCYLPALTVNRTRGLQIFSLTLSQLSYQSWKASSSIHTTHINSYSKYYIQIINIPIIPHNLLQAPYFYHYHQIITTKTSWFTIILSLREDIILQHIPPNYLVNPQSLHPYFFFIGIIMVFNVCMKKVSNIGDLLLIYS